MRNAHRRKTVEIYTDGPLIHNKQEVKRLFEEGIRMLDSDDLLEPGDTVLLRAHGVSEARKQELESRDIRVIDATCPRVTRAQKIISEHTSHGHRGIIIGDADHAEIRSILGHAKGPCTVVSDISEVGKVKESQAPFVVISQTTFDIYKIREILEALPLDPERDHIVKTICDATHKRQEAASELAKSVDVMFVVGGYHSANTRRLAQVCRRLNPLTFHIETADEIRRSLFPDAKTAGVTAGASTPSWVIQQVCDKLRKM
ncbi:MAG: 4-hydroxy-3-methylbut-2-enyl diphosphate reductase [Planctomycetota bacterium]|nr:4-hydroxy-3-methylbut-2-enyl diphosphate reductase [Planctomycetota bacterium]